MAIAGLTASAKRSKSSENSDARFSASEMTVGATPPPKTAGETSAEVAITNFQYCPGNILRYGADPSGESDSTPALRAAIKVASENLGPVVYIPPGKFKITSTLTIAAGRQVNIQGAGKFLSILYAADFKRDVPVLHFEGTSDQRIDAISIMCFAIWSNNNLARGISASWVINSCLHNLYFYQLYNGYVAADCYGISFRNNNSFRILNFVYELGEACSNNVFDATRAASCKAGIVVNGSLDCLRISGCDFEGISRGGSAISLCPPTGGLVSNIQIEGNHFENIDGTAIQSAGAEPGSVLGLVVKCNLISGGFATVPNENAIIAMKLLHVNGFEVACNNFSDWGTADAKGGGTQGFALALLSTARNGEILHNCSVLSPGTPLSVQNIADAIPDQSVRVANNWRPSHGSGFLGYAVGYVNSNVQVVPFSPKPTFDFSKGSFIVFSALANFTFPVPLNTVVGVPVRVMVKNVSGKTLSLEWGALIKQNFAVPSNGTSSVIELTQVGDSFYQTNGVGVPN